MNTTESTDKSNTKNPISAANGDWVDTSQHYVVNQKKNERQQREDQKPPARRLATGCAADFEIFGRNNQSIIVFEK
jgi:hypothetical protein